MAKTYRGLLKFSCAKLGRDLQHDRFCAKICDILHRIAYTTRHMSYIYCIRLYTSSHISWVYYQIFGLWNVAYSRISQYWENQNIFFYSLENWWEASLFGIKPPKICKGIVHKWCNGLRAIKVSHELFSFINSDYNVKIHVWQVSSGFIRHFLYN